MNVDEHRQEALDALDKAAKSLGGNLSWPIFYSLKAVTHSVLALTAKPAPLWTEESWNQRPPKPYPTHPVEPLGDG